MTGRLVLQGATLDVVSLHAKLSSDTEGLDYSIDFKGRTYSFAVGG